MKKKKVTKIRELLKRMDEIERYGKIVSLRPSVSHKSKKKYTRKEKHKKNEQD